MRGAHGRPVYSDGGAQAGASSITSNRTSSRTTPSWRWAGPIKPEVPDWDASVTAPLSTSSKSLWSRFLKPDLGRALRTWHYGAEATRASRSMDGQLVAPPLRLAMRLVPGVGAVDLACDKRRV